MLDKKNAALVQKVLGDPSLYPDELKAYIPRLLKNNINFKVAETQLPTIEQPHLVGASSEIAFDGAWANFGGSNQPALYWIDAFHVVHIGGIVKSGGIGTSIFTLPSGYRPEYAMIFAVASNNAFGVCTINPDGTVMATAGSAVYFSLSGISFRQFA